MTSRNPEITEQNPLVPMQTGDHRERLAKFVGELWAQRRHLIETRRRIDKKFADENDWLVLQDTELVD